MNVTVGFIYVSDINIYRVEEDPERKQAKKMELLEHTIPYYMNKFDELVTKNGGNIVPDVVRYFIQI